MNCDGWNAFKFRTVSKMKGKVMREMLIWFKILYTNRNTIEILQHIFVMNMLDTFKLFYVASIHCSFENAYLPSLFS